MRSFVWSLLGTDEEEGGWSAGFLSILSNTVWEIKSMETGDVKWSVLHRGEGLQVEVEPIEKQTVFKVPQNDRIVERGRKYLKAIFRMKADGSNGVAMAVGGTGKSS